MPFILIFFSYITLIQIFFLHLEKIFTKIKKDSDSKSLVLNNFVLKSCIKYRRSNYNYAI